MPPTPERLRRDDRTMTTETAPAHKHQVTRTLSTAASELPHTLSLVGQTNNGIIDEIMRPYMNPSQACLPGPIPPTLSFDRASTPEPPFVASPLSGSFRSSVSYTQSPSFDIALSERSGSTSIDSVPHNNRDEVPSNDAAYVKYGPNGAVLAATLPGLVERLIFESEDFRKDTEFRETFLMSYKAFSTADEVFRLLVERYKAVSPSEYTSQQLVSMRLSVLAVLELWLQKNHVESKDIPLLQKMRQFAASIQTSSNVSSFRDSAQRLTGLIDVNVTILSAPPLTPSFPSTTRLSFKPSEISPEELALVLTSIESDLYQKIIESDCIEWLEENHGSDGLSCFIAENKRLSYWVQKSILEIDEQAQRAAQFKYFFCIAQKCRKLRNFSTSCALFEGLTSPAISGLKRTTSNMDKSSGKLIASEKNFQEYRNALCVSAEHKGPWFRKVRKASTEPGCQSGSKDTCIPWLHVHLEDLKAKYGAPHRLADKNNHKDIINFERYYLIREQIRETVLGYQVPPLELADSARHAEIRSFVEEQLRLLMVDDALRSWLHERGPKLAREEKADHFGYAGHKQELAAVGYLRPTNYTSTPQPRRSASSAPKLSRSSSSAPKPSRSSSSANRSIFTSPWSPMNTQPAVYAPLPPPETPHEVVEGVSSLDTFDRHSPNCLDGCITRASLHPVASGGFADVRVGFLGNRKIAIKTIRQFSNGGKPIEEGKLLKRLWREHTSWTRISHPNVLECLGFTYEFSQNHNVIPSLISPWMSNGTLDEYLAKCSDTNRLKLLVAIAKGLSYLHEEDIIHGDLRAGNILISDSGEACLSDFGLSRILQLEGMTATSELSGSLRWMAPELLRDDTAASKSSDVWAYGMTILEIMSERRPYHDVQREPGVLFQIIRGQVPSRPQDGQASNILTDEVWSICQLCWILSPLYRPSMHDVLSKICRISP